MLAHSFKSLAHSTALLTDMDDLYAFESPNPSPGSGRSYNYGHTQYLTGRPLIEHAWNSFSSSPKQLRGEKGLKDRDG